MTTLDVPSEPKKVVQEVSGWLRVFDDGSVDRTWTGPPEALFLTAPVEPSSVPQDGVTLHVLPGNPNLRLYLPSSAADDQSLPILLQFHGGGFCISHYSWFMYHQFYSRLARSIPAAVVSVELPLAPEHRLPAAIHAGRDALLRLHSISRSSSAELPLGPDSLLRAAANFSRVFLIGDSSGGNLVHLVAAHFGEEPDEFWAPLKLAGGIPLHPGFVRASRSRSEIEMKSDSAFLTLDMLDGFLALGLPEGATKDHPYTCPMGAAAPPLEKLRLPPFMVAVADRDLIRDTNLEYCEAMEKAGKEVEVVINEGVSHSFYLNKIAVDNDPVTGKRTDELVDAIGDFVRRH